MATKQEDTQTPIEVNTEAKAPEQEKPKSKYSQEELLTIFDDIIFQGTYTEEVIVNKRLKVEYRIRSAKETGEISKAIESKNFQWVINVEQERAFLNLVYSLTKYATHDLAGRTLEDRIKFVGGLPTVVVSALSDKLVEFDQKTDEACRVGEANF